MKIYAILVFPTPLCNFFTFKCCLIHMHTVLLYLCIFNTPTQHYYIHVYLILHVHYALYPLILTHSLLFLPVMVPILFLQNKTKRENQVKMKNIKIKILYRSIF